MIGFIKNKMTSIVIIIMVFLLTVIGIQYVLSLKNENKIISLSSEINSLQTENHYLSSTINSLELIREVENKTLRETSLELETLKKKSNEKIKGVTNVYKEESIVDRTLPASVVRLLNDTCQSVRTEACPDP